MILIQKDPSEVTYQMDFIDPRTNAVVLTGDGYESVEDALGFALEMKMALTVLDKRSWKPEELENLSAITSQKLFTEAVIKE